MSARYIKKKLPLSGPDYKVGVDRKGSTEDFSIEKKGEVIQVDHYDNTKDVTITNQLKQGTGGSITGKIEIDRHGAMEDETITQSGDRIFIDRSGFDKDVEIKMKGSEIVINRMNNSKYTKYRKGEETWEIDRDGYRNDVKINRDSSNPNIIKIDKFGDSDDVAVEKTDGEGIDVRAWHKDLTMTPEGFELITGWLDKGLNAEDLIHLSEDGTVQILDSFLY